MRRESLRDPFKGKPVYTSIMSFIILVTAPVMYVVLAVMLAWGNDSLWGIYYEAWQGFTNRYDDE